jgi:hypothetical protein
MIRNPFLGTLAALFLGGAAGVSLCVSVLPMTLQLRGAGDAGALAFYLSGYVVPSALAWALGGVAVTRVRHLQAAGIIMGLVGVVTGTGLVGLGLAPVLEYLVIGAITGLVYGYLGGLILGRVLALPVPREDDL